MSRTKAINEKCKDCIYDHAAPGSWRAQVEACTSETSCALWPYRPLTIETLHARRKSGKAEVDDEAEAEA
jgi:hypothetical protein